MATTLVIPRYPFTAEEVEIAQEFRETLLGFQDMFGNDVTQWEGVLDDLDVQAAIAFHWAMLSGKESGTETIPSILQKLLAVTAEQFNARIINGVVPPSL